MRSKKGTGAVDPKVVIRGLLEIAKQAMPDTYFATDSRVRAAREFLGEKVPDRDPPFEKCKLNGLRCSVCGEPQRLHPSGAVCKNGHGGVPGW